jgi:hypothetical protein
MKITVIGIDPGDSTGVAVIEETRLLYAWQGEPHEALSLLRIVLAHVGSDDVCTIAMERFTPTQRHYTHQPVAQQVIGAVKSVVAEINQQRSMNNAQTHVEILMQGAADAWAVADNDLLRRLGMWQQAKDVGRPDANDANMAVRHGLLLLAKRHARLFTALIVGRA